jgi:hypothetical protein
MKAIFESVIARGGYDLSDLLKKIDSYHIDGKLTDAEKDELYDKARGHAVVNVDVMAKLLELEERVRKLETAEVPEQPDEDYPEYVPGKWYYADDKISFGGKNYVCTAPAGVVCTWNPDEYPAYWSVEE